MSTMRSRTIYIGNLPGDVREEEIEDLFYKYGKIVDIDLKIPRHPPRYCFLEYEDARDAEDAIRGRDGYDFDGHRLGWKSPGQPVIGPGARKALVQFRGALSIE